ncbi:MAG TPA: DUF928 domain-containing protein [Stellaceae bacterium]|nr:DUF928 domain-containing protein [Stellaceae bacterium]
MKHPLLIASLATLVVAASDTARAQSPADASSAADKPAAAAPPPVYKPPLRGAPGGRVGGASRAAVHITTPLPEIELLAPADHGGVTGTATPTLFYFVSRPVSWPTQFTISAPMQPQPVLETTISSPAAAGIYALRLADYRVRLHPGTIYTWSVSIILEPRAWSRNIVASGTIVFDPAVDTRAALALPPVRRADFFAGAGLWYDAVAAAAEAQSLDRHAAIDALIKQVGLTEATAYEAALAQR